MRVSTKVTGSFNEAKVSEELTKREFGELFRGFVRADVEVEIAGRSEFAVNVPLLGFYIDLRRSCSDVILSSVQCTVIADDETFFYLDPMDGGCFASFEEGLGRVDHRSHGEALALADLRATFWSLENSIFQEIAHYEQIIRRLYERKPEDSVFHALQIIKFVTQRSGNFGDIIRK